ncbi:MAG: hypothetical protein DRP46_07990 [Candidatus Zixiibacteriota bacterium]|nr:MAG: hypothetical protein DRP46_07990 [candidate division Zixibacteria bacterium]HDL04573.1 T9SS type A sorting domain-containing protein [candidate division Zixibacteria bacterium]
MKHYGIITIALVLLICTSVYAAESNSLMAPKVRYEADRVVVPLELNNEVAMTALDLPLQFSEGVTLEEVTFEGTRSEDFDFKWANIDNEKRIVVIGLIPALDGEKPDLAPGSGTIANLVFSVEDSWDMETIDVVPVELENPNHSLMFVYTENVDGSAHSLSMTPEFQGVSFVPSEVAGTELLPGEFSLAQNAPNPFNPQTRIDYDIPKATNVRLEIYNVLGQHVKTLVDEFQEPGSKSVIWDGRDNSGSTVASGIYFYRMDAGEFSLTRKMMMLK